MRPRDLAWPAASQECQTLETGRVFRCLAHGLAAVLLATMGTACHGGAATDSAVRAAQGPSAKAQATGLWDLAALRRVPRATWGEKKGLVQQVYYEGEPVAGTFREALSQ